MSFYLGNFLGGNKNTTGEGQPGTAMDVDDTKGTAEDEAQKSSNTTDFSKHSNSQIIPQRAALLKSILNFFKKAILDPSFSDSVRTGMYCINFTQLLINPDSTVYLKLYFLLVMDGSLPTSLKYIISNVEYYGPALYLLGIN